MGIQFDWTISVANLGAAFLFICTWIALFFKFKSSVETEIRVIKHDIKNVVVRQDFLSESFSQLTTLLTKVAVQEERFNGLEHRIEVTEEDIRDLQNGIGFKTEKVSGEYTRHGKISPLSK